MFYVKTFGRLQIFKAGDEISNFSSKKALLILVYILVKRTDFVSISEIGQLFYEGFPDSYVHKNLNVQLYYLRRNLGISTLELSSEREFIRVNRKIFRTDYDELLELLSLPGNAEKVKLFKPDEFLLGFSEKWIETFRRRIKEMILQYLRHESETHVVSNLQKAYVLVQQQLKMRRKPFVFALARFDGNLTTESFSLRKGDLVVRLNDYWLLLLESSEDSLKTFEGVKRRMQLFANLMLVKEEEVLEILEQILFKKQLSTQILTEEA